ncbi:MAG: acyltransferase [Rhodopirellula sp.]|nr:acyltransferase [Rhodopirellula sp.]
MKYRPEIDGLRAIAVVLVILYHAESGWCPGGYMGVDVFFVISGYLITSIIRKEVAAGRFSLLNFYERRARRILPAFLVMLAIVLSVSLWIVLPSAFKGVGRSAAASALSVSNVLFWAEDDYFAAASEEKPLLHTWSLGVEEQFYVLLPLLVLVAGAGRRCTLVMAICGAASFALSAWQVRFAPTAAFFLLPSRAWELLLGSLLTAVPVPNASARIRNIVAFCGFGAIVWGSWAYSVETIFPGDSAFIPCVGAAAIIFGSPQGLVSKLLSCRPIVFAGRISYSLYLWHWPILVLARQWNIVPLDTFQTLACITASFVVAILSWKYVEQPFRSRHLLASRRAVFSLSAAALAISFSAGSYIHFSNGVTQRFPENVVQLDNGAYDRLAIQQEVTILKWEGDAGETIYGARVAPRIAVIGDSHANALGMALGAAAYRRHESVQLFSHSGVAPLAGLRFRSSPKAHEWVDATLKQICDRDSIQDVVLVGRWASAIHGHNTDFGSYERGRSATPSIAGRTAGQIVSTTEAIEMFAWGITETVNRLRAAGKRIVVVYPVPEVGYHVPRTLARIMNRGDDIADFKRPAEYYFQRQKHVFNSLDSLGNDGITRVFPHQVLITGSEAIVQENGVPLYCDDDHLSYAGASKLVPLFESSLWSGRDASAVLAAKSPATEGTVNR